MYYVVEAACAAAEVWMIDVFLYYSTPGDRRTGKMPFIFYALFTAALVVLSFLDSTSVLRLALVFIAVCFLAVYVFHSRIPGGKTTTANPSYSSRKPSTPSAPS